MSTENVELEDGFELPGVDSQEELDRILASDDPDEIEKIFQAKSEHKKVEDSADMVDDEDKNAALLAEEAAADAAKKDETAEGKKTDTDTTKNKQDEDGAASGAEAGLSEGDDTKDRYVESKNGEHKIPYPVLENARTRAAEAEKKLAEAMDKLSALEGSSKKMADTLKQQGIDLDALEKGELLSEEQLKSIEEADPTIARVIGVLIDQQRAANEKLVNLEQSTNPSVSPVDLAIMRNADLSTWQQSDPDRWSMATFYDDQLRADPAWKDKPMDARFAEAVKRTKELFGDTSDTKLPQNTNTDSEAARKAAEAKIAEAAAKATPRSLTDVGAAPDTERSHAERLIEMNDSQLEEQFANMTPEQIDKVLSEIEII